MCHRRERRRRQHAWRIWSNSTACVPRGPSGQQLELGTRGQEHRAGPQQSRVRSVHRGAGLGGVPGSPNRDSEGVDSDGEIPTDHAIDVAVAPRRSAGAFATSSPDELRTGRSVCGLVLRTRTGAHSDVHRRYGTVDLKTFPHIGLLYLLFYVNAIRRIRTVSILNYIDYRKDDAKLCSSESSAGRTTAASITSRYTPAFIRATCCPRSSAWTSATDICRTSSKPDR